TTSRVSEGIWYNIAMGYDGSSAKLFINGSEECEINSVTSGFQPASQNLTFGTQPDGSEAWAGKLSRLKIYSNYPTGDDINDPADLFNLEQLEHTISPDQISGLAMWLDPQADVAVDGSNRISQWSDQSGNNYHAVQSDDSEKPTLSAAALNGRPGVHFSSANGQHFPIQDLSYGLSGLPSMTFVAVVESTGDGHICSFDRSAVFRFEINSGRTELSSTDDSGSIDDYADSTNVQDGGIHIVIGVYDQTTGHKRIYVDGVLSSQDTAAHTAGSALGGGSEIPRFGFIGVGSEASVFDGTRGPEDYFDGTMGDLIFYERALSDAEIDEVESYLIQKYSLPY
ncbi:MAG: LamG-like jellyroll fold domain-containing protein, partial [Pseudomonadota bacterium]